MAILSNLEPKRVFEIFEEMCAIPHGSTNTKAISDYCVKFAKDRDRNAVVAAEGGAVRMDEIAVNDQL